MPEDEANKEVYPGTIQTAATLIFRNGEILLVQYLEGAKKDKVGIPGGRMRLGESLKETAVRELTEEVDLGLSEDELEKRIKSFPNNVFTNNYFPMKDGTYRQASFTAYYLDGSILEGLEVTSREPEKLAPVWMKVEDVLALSQEQKFDNTDNAINSYLESTQNE